MNIRPATVRVPKLAGVTDTLRTMRAENSIPKGIPIGRKTPRGGKNKGTPRDNKDAPPPLKSAEQIKAQDKKIRRRRAIVEEDFRQDEYVRQGEYIAPENQARRRQDCRELIFYNYYEDKRADRAFREYQAEQAMLAEMELTQQRLFQAII